MKLDIRYSFFERDSFVLLSFPGREGNEDRDRELHPEVRLRAGGDDPLLRQQGGRPAVRANPDHAEDPVPPVPGRARGVGRGGRAALQHHHDAQHKLSCGQQRFVSRAQHA